MWILSIRRGREESIIRVFPLPLGQFIQGGDGCLRLNGVDAHFRTCMKDKHFVFRAFGGQG